MPHKKTQPGATRLTPEQVFEQMKALGERAEVEGFILVAVVDGRRLALWGADHETAALGCMQSAAELQQYAAGWLGQGGMRPGPQTH